MGYGLNISITFLSLFGLLGFLGNTFVIFVILRKFQAPSWTYLLVCHLAFGDLLASIIGAPMWIATYASKDTSVCRAAILSSTVPLVVSCLTLILIAYDRFTYIHQPLQYHLIISKRKMTSLLVAVWLVSLGSSIALVTYDVNSSDPVLMRHCVLTRILNRWMLLFIFLTFSLLPLLALIVIYSYILRTALRQQRKTFPSSTSVAEKREKATKLRKERQTVLMLCVVVLAFVVSTLPYSIVALLDAVDENIVEGNRSVYLTSMLLFLNSVINPFLYTSSNKQLRNQVRKIIPW